MDVDLDRHLWALHENGFTVFDALFSVEQVDRWKSSFERLIEEGELSGGGGSQWVRDLVERDSSAALPLVADPTLVGFAEQLMGPFVQAESVVMAGFPAHSHDCRGLVHAWHRDRLLGLEPIDGTYLRPLLIVVMVYLEDLDDARGPLRVIPGSHMQRHVICGEAKTRPHEREQLLHLRAGDAVVFHSHLLHSGTKNVSGGRRHFIGVTYNHTWMKQEDDYSGPNCKRILADARQRGDRRLQRLLGEDERLSRRLNSGPVVPSTKQWSQWATEDDGALLGPLHNS
jgi:Phytanoyl-CoA dioxygenase (PhyH)